MKTIAEIRAMTRSEMEALWDAELERLGQPYLSPAEKDHELVAALFRAQSQKPFRRKRLPSPSFTVGISPDAIAHESLGADHAVGWSKAALERSAMMSAAMEAYETATRKTSKDRKSRGPWVSSPENEAIKAQINSIFDTMAPLPLAGF